jgi:RHS repeat-associated protein
MLRNGLLSLSLASATLPLLAQVGTGMYPHGTFDNKGFDTIDVGDLNLHLTLPVLSKTGRGLPFAYSVSYDGSVWHPSGTAWAHDANFGWTGLTIANLTGYITYSTVQRRCFMETQYVYYYVENNWQFHDSSGKTHNFGGSVQDGTAGCATEPYEWIYTTTDGSGLTIDATFGDASITTVSGTGLGAPLNVNSGAGVMTDPNGNEVSVDSSGHYMDTTGNVVLTAAGGAPNPLTFTYTDSNGHSQVITVNYRTYTIQTAFGCTWSEYGPLSASLVDNITYPDGSVYHFAYETTPGHSPNVTGRLASVTLPQGGVITYTYTGGNNGIVCADGGAAGITRSLAADSGSAASTWTYARTPGTGTSHTEVTDGLGNHIAYDFVIPSSSLHNFYETNRKMYQGAESGTPVLSRQTCYNGATPTCTTTAFSMPVSQIDTWETLDGIETHGSTTKYNIYGLPTEGDVFDFAASATNRGSLLKKEVRIYSSSIPDLVTNDYVYDATQAPSGQTTYTYDAGTLTTSSGVPQHVAASGARGNLTGRTICANTTTCYSMSATYEDTGSILTSVAPNGTTRYSYDPTFVYQTGVQYPTPSSGVTLSTSATFDTSYSGLPLTSKDFNNQQTSYSAYDLILRPKTIGNPDGGSTTIQYESFTQTGILRKQNSTTSADTENLVDGYARPSRTAVANGQAAPKNWYQQDVCYDANGNSLFSSYRYQANGFATSKVCSGAGDTSTYDVLGRLTRVTRQTGETVTYSYHGRATQLTDENGVSRIFQIDGLGRPTIVCEISSSTLQGVSPTSCGTDISGTGFTTTYAYTLATPTTTVTQGAQTRTFQTDWLGRTTSVTEPESGTTTYSYAYNSTGLVVTRKKPKANQSSATTLTTTTYQYDSMSRLVSVTYDDGTTPTKTFAYDASAGWSDLTQSNLKGRMSLASVTPANATAKTIFNYDAMGRITDLDECLPSGCGNSSYNKKLHYAYDWTGNLLSSKDDGSITSTYTVSVAGEDLSLTSDLNNSTNKPNVLSNVVNGPNGPVSFSLGNGLTGVYSYDSIGRTSGGWLCSGGSTSPGCTGGTQSYGFTSAWKGLRLTGSSDSVLNQTSSYGYDEFNRLSSRTVTSGTVQNFTYVYDRYGNRVQQNVTAGTGPAPVFSFVASTNQITPSTCNPPTATQYCYDAAGNMTADGFHTYTYDAEGDITAVDAGQTAQFFYNALNQRIKRVAGSTSREFVFNASGQRVSIWNGSVAGQHIEGQYYWRSKPVAYYSSGGSQHFQHQDWLGTERRRTSYSGTVEDSYTSLPFGDAQTTGTDTDQYHFATLDYDSETNTDHAQFRQFSTTQGRWLRPDPYAGSYDFSNPQSLNRYAYVLDNPLFFIDPDGDDSNPALCALLGYACNYGSGGGYYASLEMFNTNFTLAFSSSDGKYTYTYQDGTWIATDGNGNSTPLTQGASEEAGLPTSFASFSMFTFSLGSSGPSGSGPGGAGPAPNDPKAKPNYYKVTCFGDFSGTSYSKGGCSFACGGEEEWGPFPDFPTAGVMYFTQKQLTPVCGSRAEVFCPSKLTVEGNYTPGTGWDSNPYITSCKMGAILHF